MLLVAVLVVLQATVPVKAMRADRIAALRRQTVDMFYHGFDHYMAVAFPEDELRPISCVPLARDQQNHENYVLNDVLGNYSLTLIDSLSTLAILASAPADDVDSSGDSVAAKALLDFQDGVAALVRLYGDGRPGPSGAGQRARGFDVDSHVQVFETVIRGVGGLLSAHQFAVGALPITGYAPVTADGEGDMVVDWPGGFRYDGQLLRLARDLATRLLPAFDTPTGMPYPRVNLRYGVYFHTRAAAAAAVQDSGRAGDSEEMTPSRPPNLYETTETCSAGAGSLVLEFTVLSRLTGDARFEQLAKRAFWAVWHRRSTIGLIGAGVDAEQGRWIGAYSVIGAGADSFFEYALKTHILLSGQALPNRTQVLAAEKQYKDDGKMLLPVLSDEENAPEAFLEAWHLAHAAIKRHLYRDREHPHYINVNLYTGSQEALWIDSLGAYYAGLLALAGELDEAVATNLLYAARWSLRDRGVEGGLGWWPLRPEFIESVYHLHRATRDPWYLYVGEMVQSDIQRRCWTPCGWAGLQDVVSGEMTDRMESFFLGETAKYMYLLFDDRHPLNALDTNFVYTTEGHPLILPRKATHRYADRPPQRPKRSHHQPNPSTPPTHNVGVYDDNSFTNTCPRPPTPDPLTGSAITARNDLFHAARVLDLHRLDNATGSKSGTAAFPWTLPPAMLPANGISAKVHQPQELVLEFAPAMTDGSGGGAYKATLASQALQRTAADQIRVLNIAGLKLELQLEDGNDQRTWRIMRVNGVPMGRDEILLLDRALVSHISDPRFTLVRDPVVLKLHHMHHAVWVEDVEGEEGKDEQGEVDKDEGDTVQKMATSGIATRVRSIWRHLVSSLEGDDDGGTGMPIPTLEAGGSGRGSGRGAWLVVPVEESASTDRVVATSANDSKDHRLRHRRPTTPVNWVLNATGVMPTGPGAAPLPAVDTPAGVQVPVKGAVPTELLPWRTVYAGGTACEAVLPETAARDHEVLVLRRGGCSFSEKLAHVPAVGGRRLALVVVVSDNDDIRLGGPGLDEGSFHVHTDYFVRPMLEVPQLTPGGLPRWQPLAMVMVGGGEAAYREIAAARQLGLTRRYAVECHGMRIRNLMLDDGDA